MASYLINILATIPVMLFVAIFISSLALNAGDPAAIIAGDFATDEQIAENTPKTRIDGTALEAVCDLDYKCAPI